ncbi:MAG TPA: MerR family transcriptional regulator [Nocardioidaceae bacterium]|nr:MerR family transcriptional regulator [Nocardioidaceae bacterium]
MTGAVPARSGGRLSIGAVLSELASEFPDVTVSKIRYLESEGLVEPERAPSGYRKFSRADVERLRYVLAAQRDHYLPLRVIREHLDAISRGLEPPAAAGEPARPPRALRAVPDPAAVDPPRATTRAPRDIRMSREELLANTGLTDQQLSQLEGFGLVRPCPGTRYFDSDAFTVASTVAEMAAYGLEPRHLRAFKTAADREVGLVEQVVSPLTRQRDGASRARADHVAADLARLSVQLHATLVRIGLRTAP